ncbi:MAG: hypothetical protein M1312_01380 [Patescibacteria group bacterium]|nr:hypothetical protein [Patescibacteria group bacterium]MDE2144604.1 hypothetical protein [Patescibacteria group bacterium]
MNNAQLVKTIKKAEAYLTFFIVAAGFFIFSSSALAATNIDATNHWAWNDNIGWVDFYSTGNVNVSGTGISGYASSTMGDVALDCNTSPNGYICNNSNFQVVNDGNGNLAGWAWNDNIGWISFCGNNSGGSTWNGSTWICPASSTYEVTIDSYGNFQGWAWNDNIGWLSFNCDNTNTCGTVSYLVTTVWSPQASGWLESSTFDTGSSGTTYNSIMWNGTLPTGTSVKFQLATATSSSAAWGGTCSSNACNSSSCDGDFIGPDGTSNSYYTPTGPGIPTPITACYANSKRYYRYIVYLTKSANATGTPSITSVVVNWSP